MSTNLNAKQTLYDVALSDIREMIISGTFPAGTPLRETEIAKQLDISRAPVREAFRILAEDNLVEYIPNRGVRVKQFSRSDIEEINEVRQMIDCHIIDNYFDNFSAGTINELARYAAKMEDPKKYSEYNNLFHAKFVSMCTNERIQDLWNSMKNQVSLLVHSCARDTSLLKISVYFHNEIVHFLKEGDKEKCKEAIRINYETATKTMSPQDDQPV